jgi:hypothetical protein
MGSLTEEQSAALVIQEVAEYIRVMREAAGGSQ